MRSREEADRENATNTCGEKEGGATAQHSERQPPSTHHDEGQCGNYADCELLVGVHGDRVPTRAATSEPLPEEMIFIISFCM